LFAGYADRSWLRKGLSAFVSSLAGERRSGAYDCTMPGTLAARPFGSPCDMLDVWIDEFDVLYRERAGAARLFCVNRHHCMMGRPAISMVLDRLWRTSPEGVWFARGRDIAEFWLQQQVKRSPAA
jgi:hypothetical protein